jgi:integrase
VETHELIGGKLHVYKRDNSRYWQCSTYLAGRNWRVSTKHESLAHAKDFAEDWYMEKKGLHRAGEIATGRKFPAAADQFLREYEVITEGQRNPEYVQGHGNTIRVHLQPFFGNMYLTAITAGTVQEYRIHRNKTSKTGRPLARSTLSHEICTLRQILKTAHRHGWLPYVPDLSPPYKTSGKITHRAWFSKQEYRQLYEATRRRVKQPLKASWRWSYEQLHDYVLFMANTGLRPDEASRLEFRDVTIVRDDGTGETILEIEVRGKRGVGFCKSTTGAVGPFIRLRKRNNPDPTDRLFPKKHRTLFNAILKEENLKFDRDGNMRTPYSLRHTYICLRLMEGADIYQIAKNCRTSVEMIEKYYATHIKSTLDAAAINVRKPKPAPRPKRKPDDDQGQPKP